MIELWLQTVFITLGLCSCTPQNWRNESLKSKLQGREKKRCPTQNNHAQASALISVSMHLPNEEVNGSVVLGHEICFTSCKMPATKTGQCQTTADSSDFLVQTNNVLKIAQTRFVQKHRTPLRCFCTIYFIWDFDRFTVECRAFLYNFLHSICTQGA